MYLIPRRGGPDNSDHGGVFRTPELGVLWMKYTDTYVQPRGAFVRTVFWHNVVGPHHPLGICLLSLWASSVGGVTSAVIFFGNVLRLFDVSSMQGRCGVHFT